MSSFFKDMVDVTDANFEQEVIEKSKQVPVVVDFWADWCAPCQMLGPILEKLSEKYEGKFVLVKVDVNQNQNKPAEYGVMSIPAVKLFKNGEIADEFVGALPESKVIEWLDKNLQ